MTPPAIMSPANPVGMLTRGIASRIHTAQVTEASKNPVFSFETAAEGLAEMRRPGRKNAALVLG